mmetsp:Transcript_443/g.813  ORF Transcript_443/g.813 Transcript_443/m.813 type:complete len:191 (+) Transcript_443:43-615(+)
MLARIGHGGNWDNVNTSIIKETFRREKQTAKGWEQKFGDKIRKETQKKLNNRTHKPEENRIKDNGDPQYKCVGWGIAPLSKRNQQLELLRGGTNGEEFVQSKYGVPHKSVHNRTKKLEQAMYELSGISCLMDKNDDSDSSDSEIEEDEEDKKSVTSHRSRVSANNKSQLSFGTTQSNAPSFMKSTYRDDF